MYYLRALAEYGRKNRIATVCYQPLVGGRASGSFVVLLSDEWGEKEILKKMKDLGLFSKDESFVPVGPRLAEDLKLLTKRAVHHHLLRMDEKGVQRFVQEKRSLAGNDIEVSGDSKTFSGLSRDHDSSDRIVEELRKEIEAFLEENVAILGSMKT